jgi:hypothetical protein
MDFVQAGTPCRASDLIVAKERCDFYQPEGARLGRSNFRITADKQSNLPRLPQTCSVRAYGVNCCARDERTPSMPVCWRGADVCGTAPAANQFVKSAVVNFSFGKMLPWV